MRDKGDLKPRPLLLREGPPPEYDLALVCYKAVRAVSLNDEHGLWVDGRMFSLFRGDPVDRSPAPFA